MLSKTQYFLSILIAVLAILNSTSANAGWSCDLIGIGCSAAVTPVGAGEGNQIAVDQNNPPEVFAFTVSGTFDTWSDIPAETFICDTRERKDRSCRYRGHIPEIARYATVVFKPFPHDRGVYKVRALIEHNLGKDTNFRTKVGVPQKEAGVSYLAPIRQISIAALAENVVEVQFFEGNKYTVSNTKNSSIGSLQIKFKGVLK